MFVETKNYLMIRDALDLQRQMIGDFRPIIIVSGEYGTGKTQCLNYLSAQNDYPLVRAEVGMTIKSLLINIANNCRIAVSKRETIDDIKAMLKVYFDSPDKVLMVDEADFVVPRSLLETLRWLVDETDMSLLLAGMGNFEKSLGIYPHFLDRSPNPEFRVRLKKIDRQTLVELIATNYEYPYTDSAIDYIMAHAKGKYRQTVWLLDKSSAAAVRGGFEKITESILEAL